ncbi:hypothetical protein FXB79_09785 [Aggregatibacter actinomycetemcomitans]|uniref:Uncharacterized protein n=1 Tax=Aggregatibacter actinomycetemcomitans TaxID=714 RepID=A0AB74N2D1_AGGAC|nr:hypothetical protein FXE08_09735 [Aggregatibacter actinomycetemcomitans]TYA38278.1 hypothetical protein FXB79_09785 [Aggregatibacter actinomycetemcomitans]
MCKSHKRLRSPSATSLHSIIIPNSVSTCILRVFKFAELITVNTSSIMVTFECTYTSAGSSLPLLSL